MEMRSDNLMCVYRTSRRALARIFPSLCVCAYNDLAYGHSAMQWPNNKHFIGITFHFVFCFGFPSDAIRTFSAHNYIQFMLCMAEKYNFSTTKTRRYGDCCASSSFLTRCATLSPSLPLYARSPSMCDCLCVYFFYWFVGVFFFRSFNFSAAWISLYLLRPCRKVFASVWPMLTAFTRSQRIRRFVDVYMNVPL